MPLKIQGSDGTLFEGPAPDSTPVPIHSLALPDTVTAVTLESVDDVTVSFTYGY